MLDRPRIAIVGGGVLGLSTALAAAELGAEVTVLEAGALAGESSGLSAGHLGTQFVDRRAMELRARGLPRFAELERDCGVPIRRIGYLRLGSDPDDVEAFAQAVENQRQIGIEGPAVLTPEQIHAKAPDVDLTGVVGALYGPDDGYTDGHLLVSAYAEKAVAAGAKIRQQTRVVGHERGSAGGHTLSTDRGDAVECDVVVNAAGAWAERIGDLLGAPVPIIAQRHQTCIARPSKPLGYTMPIVMNYVASEQDFGLYFRQEGEDHLLVGLHTEDLRTLPVADPDNYERGVSADFVELVAERLAERMPSLVEDLGLKEGWSGLYPNSPDHHPIVGPDPGDPTVIAAAGGGSSGVQLSPVIGQLAAEWAVGGAATSVEAAEELGPGRFGGAE